MSWVNPALSRLGGGGGGGGGANVSGIGFSST